MTLLPSWLTGVRIVEDGPVPAALEGATASGVLWQAAPGRFLLDVPDVGRYLVADGQTITLAPLPTAQPEDVARFARLAPLAALLYQRGIMAFHAAAAVPPAATGKIGAILLAGDSGTGKSVLLATLLRRGWTMLADELAVVDVDERSEFVVRPTFAEVRLWPDAADALDWREPTGPLAPTAMPLRAIYRLATHSRDDVALEELPAMQRFRAIGALTYNSHIADALLDRTVYLGRAAAIANAVPIRCLRRPRRGWSAGQLADLVEGA